MNLITRNRLLWAIIPVVGLLAGCGNYTITFEVADVINAWGDDVTREMLDVDILCLTKEDVENHPEIVNRSMTADEWFKARDERSHAIGDIAPKRIYALRRGNSGDFGDNLLGEPLLSAKDRRDGLTATSYKIKHSQGMNGEAAIVVYGRFSSQTGIAKTPPLVIQPPGTKEDIFIKVSKNGMSLVSQR